MATANMSAPVGNWALASDGLVNVLISTMSNEAVKVHIGTAAPAAGAPFHEMTRAKPFSMSGISGQKVYIQSGTQIPIDVSVTAV